MDRTLSWIRENPQFSAIIGFLVILTIVVTALGVSMARAGASLRPIVFFLGFVGIVAGPQAFVHLLDGFVLRKARIQSEVTPETAPIRTEPSRLNPVDWSIVFGPKADPTLITDAKRGLSQILGDAIEAKLSFNVDGESALAARFPSANAAAKALDIYGTFFAFDGAQGSDAHGWTARRHGGQGEWVHVVSAGPELYAWTGAEKKQVLANRARALGPVPDFVEATAKPADAPAANLVSNQLRSKVGLMSAFVCINLVVAVLWFFKGSAWAARIQGSEMARPASEQAVRSALLGINKTDVPTDVTLQPDGSIAVTWRYANARWFDLMRVHQMKRTQRLVLHFDERHHMVRVREYWSAFDASAGMKDLRLDWKMATGIQFFAIEHKRVFGVQLGADGKPTGELSKAYTFNLQELKAPIIEAVTRAGWTWQPVTWNAPAAFRWLTE
jgi:hypothetical protein